MRIQTLVTFETPFRINFWIERWYCNVGILALLGQRSDDCNEDWEEVLTNPHYSYLTFLLS